VQPASQLTPPSSAIPGSENSSGPPAVAVSSAATPPGESPGQVASGQSQSRGAAENAASSGVAARGTAAAISKYSFEQAWQKAELQIGDGELARALLTLSEFYGIPDLDAEAQSRLIERLDQLAGTVIYSRRHLLEESYKTNRGDTLRDLAARCNVSAMLLQNINGVQDPNLVLPGPR
jgi:hypothetical protein